EYRVVHGAGVSTVREVGSGSLFKGFFQGDEWWIVTIKGKFCDQHSFNQFCVVGYQVLESGNHVVPNQIHVPIHFFHLLEGQICLGWCLWIDEESIWFCFREFEQS